MEWADHVIVADQSSTDGSVDVYRKLEKQYSNLEIIYDRPKMDWTTPDIRNYMLKQVRRIEGNNIVFELHADEIVSAKILQNDIKKELLQKMSIGTCLELPWLTLWKHPLQYRSDNSIWSNNTCVFAFRDDRTSDYQSAVFHGYRVPENYIENKIKLNHVPVLHYQFVNIGADMSKQALYQIFERNHYPAENIFKIYELYSNYFDERNMKCEELKEEDYAPWVRMGLNIHELRDDEDFCWRDVEVLKNFNIYGLDRYAKVLIWHINWEKKRQLAFKKGIQNIPSYEIVDPRSLNTRITHKFVMKYQMLPFWEINFIRLIISKAANRVRRKICNWH